MTQFSTEERLAALEAEVAQLKQNSKGGIEPWYKQITGVFENDPLFEEAVRLGREWREAQREEYDQVADNQPELSHGDT